MDREEPSELLAAATQAVQRTREARRGFWFPLVLFGIIIIGAAPWYRVGSDTGCFGFTPVGSQQTLCSDMVGGGFFGLYPGVDSTGTALYWLVAVVLGYAATVAFYHWRRLRTGVAGRILPYVLTGVALLALAVMATPTVSWHWHQDPFTVMPGDLSIRGMAPLLVVALGLFVLARLERSVPLAAFACLFLTVALVSNLYDVENQTPAIGWTPSEQWSLLPNLWLSGFTLLLGGIGFGLAVTMRARSRGRGQGRR